MNRGIEAPSGGLVLFTAPTERQRQTRRRSAALAVILGVAFAGGLIGQLSSVHDAARPTPPGPFSYFPN
ncbi:hypothetical protein [Phenylobacterium sp.]|uniref:hypothetical protein n=1 Tax=Phenylobacterium sp. TaxID=1871053 RepID=UPI0027218B5A|nr:hypothetical protein [Phenylobacterium sp.]MDO8381142.1 hypothetical protein [Phenylobacterium sp.]